MPSQIQAALQQRRIPYGSTSLFQTPAFTPATVTEALQMPALSGVKNSSKTVVKIAKAIEKTSGATKTVTRVTSPLVRSARKVPFFGRFVDVLVLSEHASRHLDILQNAVVDPKSGLYDLMKESVPGGDTAVRISQAINNLSPESATEALVAMAGFQPSPVSTALRTQLREREREKEKRCPQDAGTAADGSRCGGRSAESRGATPGYDGWAPHWR